ncbi:MAG: hypothetical protein ACMG6E_05255 [Candidatus Roizmanbacteria bacterium]
MQMQQQLVELGIPVLTAFPKGKKDDFKIIYLRTRGYRPDAPVKVVLEELGDVLSLHRCALYLAMLYPDRELTIKDVERCYYIMKLVLQKANSIDVDIFYETYWQRLGTITTTKLEVLQRLFSLNHTSFSILCGDANDIDSVQLTLLDLLDDEEDFAYFNQYWQSVANYEDVRNILLQFLAPDIVDYIGTL